MTAGEREAGPAVAPSSWRVIRDGPAAGARNMALDHALAGTFAEAQGVLRLYSWERPTVSFGRNEPTRGRYSTIEARARGIDFVRRPTGGRAVLHHAEVTYAIVVAERALGGPRAAYEAINRGLVRGLRTLGVDADLAKGGEVLRPDAGPCFNAPGPGEVTVGGRKLVGSAQVRQDGALLQHGSLPLRGNQRMLEVLAPSAGSSRDPASLEDSAGDVAASAVEDALVEGFRKEFGGAWREDGYTAAELAEASQLEIDWYLRDEWTWRR